MMVTLSDYKSCGNCVDDRCFAYALDMGFKTDGICNDWKPIPCPSCGGVLSDVREHNGKKYRHCYACHFEFEVEVK